jgi:tripartite-type tricarboxylate transporter receptor subunit TctC
MPAADDHQEDIVRYVNFHRRHFLRLSLGLAGAAALAGPGSSYACSLISGRSRLLALSWPTRPVRLVVAAAAGGAGDVAARLLEKGLPERLGQPFVVEDRNGVANVPTEAVRCALPDGYTLVVTSATNAIDTMSYGSPNCHVLDDATPVAGLLSAPLVMALGPSVPADTVPSFIAYARDNKVSMASSGSGTPSHLAGKLFKMMAGAGMAHVPYRGEAPAVADVLAGQAQVCFVTLPAALAPVRDGRLRALAVTGASRSHLLPDVPAITEFLPGYEATAWVGLNAPRNTPPEIVEKLNRAVNSALADTGVKEHLASAGATPLSGSPADYGRLIADETGRWARAVDASGAGAN